MIWSRWSEVQVAKYLGTSVEMVQETYANHLRQRDQEDIAEFMGDLF